MTLDIALRAVSVQRGRKWVLREVTLDLEGGGRWALLGGNGAGKTQLLKLIAGDVWPTPTGRERRVYRAGGRDLDLTEAKGRIAYLGAELQDKYARYGWDLTVRELLATGAHGTDLLLSPVSEREKRLIEATLSACGLRRLAPRRLSSLSYGQKRLALLARALCQPADWLLLDELYNGLDARYRRLIDRALRSARSRGRAWIVAAHRAADVPRGTRGLIELERGRVLSVRSLEPAALARLSRAARERSTERARATRTVASRRGANAPLIELRGVDLYVEYRAVLQRLDWQLHQGEHWAVFGANGAGKSSFLKLLYGDLAPALGGTIERRGVPRGTPIADWKRQIGFVSPELQTDYAVDVSVRELVASGRYASIGLNDPPTRADLASALRWLKFFRLGSMAERRPRELSYGQLRRALIARALVAEPSILLLDEPLTGLDPAQRAFAKRLLERLMRSRITLVIAVHHAEDLPRGITHALRLEGGRARARTCDSAKWPANSQARRKSAA
jgi:molybdate transport system ATP-binding protein